MTEPTTTACPLNDLVVCPDCDNLSRVERHSIGTIVDCPHCKTPFYAQPVAMEPEQPKLVRPRQLEPGERFIPTVHPPKRKTPTETGFAPTIVALLVLPWAIPLLWLIGPMVTGHSPVFSFAAPVSLAVCGCGLGAGIGVAHGWSFGTRVRAMLALLLLASFLGGFLFFMKKEWAEGIRKHVGPSQLQWQDFQPSDGSYSISIPGRAVRRNDELLPGWNLEAYHIEQTAKRTDKAFEVIYDLAHGYPTDDDPPPKASDEEWFSTVRKAIVKKYGGELTAELTVDRTERFVTLPGRQYNFTLADGTTNRIVQVYRSRNRLFLLTVEGTFIPSDASYVRRYFDSFEVVQ